MPGGDAAVFRMGLLLLQRGLPPGVVWDNDRLRARPKAVSKQRHVCVAAETDLYNLPDSAAECEIRMSAFLSFLVFFFVHAACVPQVFEEARRVRESV